jgi:hypothetical protein
MDYSTKDWAVFEHPSHGGPIMPSGTGVPGDSDLQKLRARMDFFRESWRQKIGPRLSSLEKPEDRIEYLLFVRYDAAENQILTRSDEAERFLDRLDTQLRHLYRELFEVVRDQVRSYPPEKKKDRLRELLLTERQRVHSDSTPSFDNFSSLVEYEIEKIDLQGQDTGLPDIFEGRPTLRNYAYTIVEKYIEQPTSLPEKMGRFKSWVSLRNGENMVTQLQRAIREANLSDRYNHGDPESFCDLVEKLLQRHDRSVF